MFGAKSINSIHLLAIIFNSSWMFVQRTCRTFSQLPDTLLYFFLRNSRYVKLTHIHTHTHTHTNRQIDIRPISLFFCLPKSTSYTHKSIYPIIPHLFDIYSHVQLNYLLFLVYNLIILVIIYTFYFLFLITTRAYLLFCFIWCHIFF